MKAPTKRIGRAPSRDDAAPASSKLTKISAEREIVQRLQYFLAELDRLPLPIGTLWVPVFGLPRIEDKIRDKVRQKARELLLKSPGMIPCWHVSEVPQRRLSCDTGRVFDALSREDDTLTPERFLEGCTTNLGAVRRLLGEQNPEWTPDEREHVLNRALSDLISFEKVTRLSRSKDKQLGLSL